MAILHPHPGGNPIRVETTGDAFAGRGKDLMFPSRRKNEHRAGVAECISKLATFIVPALLQPQ